MLTTQPPRHPTAQARQSSPGLPGSSFWWPARTAAAWQRPVVGAAWLCLTLFGCMPSESSDSNNGSTGGKSGLATGGVLGTGEFSPGSSGGTGPAVPPADGTGGSDSRSATGGSATTGGASGTGGSVSTGGASSGSGGRVATSSGGATAGGTTGGMAGRGVPSGTGGGAVGGGGVVVGGPSQCTAGKYVICEDFEATEVGAVPTGWTKHGNAAVAADQAARGMHALKISAAPSGERRIYADATKLGSGHWGRIFYRVELPVPTVFVHSTIVGLQGVGPTGGNGEYRVVDTVKDASGKHQFLYNVQPSGGEFGKGSAYNWTFDGKWHCAEWHIDNPTQSFHYYFDGTEVTQIALNNGMGVYKGTDIPPVFSQVHVGWNNYQSAAPGFVAWVDEVAMDANRIGCEN